MKEFPNFLAILLEALLYPEYARPEFYMKKQEESGWSKGVFLRSLHEAIEHFRIKLHLKQGIQKKTNPDLEPSLSLEKETKNRQNGVITNEILKSLGFAIDHAFKLNAIIPVYSNIQRIRFLEFGMQYVNRQYKKELTLTLVYPQSPKSVMVSVKEMDKKYTITQGYHVATQLPIFDINGFKVAVNELMLSTTDRSALQIILRPIVITAQENVKMWNEQLSGPNLNQEAYTQKGTHYLESSPYHEIDNNLKIWSVVGDKKDSGIFSFYLSHELAVFSVNILNFLVNQIFNGKIPTYNFKNIELKEPESAPATMEELFYKHEMIEPCINMLRMVDRPLLNGNSFTKRYKTAFAIWFEVLINAQVIRYVANIHYNSLLSTRIMGITSDTIILPIFDTKKLGC